MLSSLKIWLNHFEYHAQHPRRIGSGIPDSLTHEERALIGPSISIFQRGEQSEGAHLLRAAYRFAQLHEATEVARITELLILEEQQHAALLGAFMAEHAIAPRGKHWTDTVFRRLRRLAELELAMTVLLTAELIGILYYRALEAATGSQRLRLLCRVLVADELAHVGFESDLLIAMRARRGGVSRAAVEFAHRALFTGAAVVVWVTHRAVLRRAGYGMRSFLKACRAQYAFHLEAPPVSATPYRRGQPKLR